jgi:hypothetical protein
MNTVLISIEGVLGDHSTLHGFYPLPEGIKLAHTLRTGYQVTLATTRPDEASVEYWLRLNGMVSPGFYDGLMFRKQEWSDLTDAELRAEQAAELRRAGADLGFVVSDDPATILLVTEQGIPALLFTNPSYRWAEYRPDKKRLPKPWEQIDEEVVRQKELRATDPRLSEMEPEQI